VILNIIEATESSQTTSRTGSRGADSSFNIERNFSCQSIQGQLYHEGFGNGGYGATNRDNDSNANFSDVNGNQILTHSESIKQMN